VGLTSTTMADEFGNPLSPTMAGSTRYGWLGSALRAGDSPNGLMLMGVRLYNSVTGRFLSVDPVSGGSANDYDYANADPVNSRDLDGRRPDDGGGGVASCVCNSQTRKWTTYYTTAWIYSRWHGDMLSRLPYRVREFIKEAASTLTSRGLVKIHSIKTQFRTKNRYQRRCNPGGYYSYRTQIADQQERTRATLEVRWVGEWTITSRRGGPRCRTRSSRTVRSVRPSHRGKKGRSLPR
jgi:RHS repeat-associated protein